MRTVVEKLKRALWEIKRFGGFFFRAGQELLKSGWKRRNARYARYRHHYKIKSNLVLYEAFMGRGMLCGPYALFNEMMSNPMYSHMRHIWVLDDPKYHTDLIRRYRRCKNVKFVKYMSRNYLKVLCQAKYLINNVTFASFFAKRAEQVYINTWHGIPLKKLGFDMQNGAEATKNIIRNFMQTDYLVSANSFLTEIYKKSYKLDGIFEGTIIEEGYPRLDTLVNSNQETVTERLKSAGVNITKDKKLILYAPTWKEAAETPDQIIGKYKAVKDRIEKALPQYQVLVKAHQFVYEQIRDCAEVNYIIPATMDANEVLSLADILISDYSSIFFDYLFFERPILFYIPDLQEYTKYRGLYVTVDQLPGPYSENLNDIIQWLGSIDEVSERYIDKVKSAKEWSRSYGAGQIAKRILDIAIYGQEDGCCLIKGLGKQQQKKKILLHRGRMRINGISTSFLNLLQKIDLNKYDVSVVITQAKDADEQKLVESIDPRIRVLMREGTFNYTFFTNVRSRMMNEYGINGIMAKIWPKQMYRDETIRCFGNSSFDVAIDFEGYSLAYALIIAMVPNAVHAIWQHNDMKAEQEVRFPYLAAIFSAYSMFDRIVSCSKEIMEVNRKKLATEETYKKYTYAKNLLDAQKIERLMAQGKVVEIESKPHCVMEKADAGDAIKEYSLIPLDALSSQKKSSMRFITIGRLSPEKNQGNLIAAFGCFVREGHNAMLYILGDGPLKQELMEQIEKTGMKNRIIMTGNVRNPFALMKHCDCFVLPSLHEGQPMVIHEARIMGLPIIMSNFSSAQGSMIPNGQYVVGIEAEDILEGLNAFVEGKVPSNYTFDVSRYNREAYEEFLCAIGEHEYGAKGIDNAE